VSRQDVIQVSNTDTCSAKYVILLTTARRFTVGEVQKMVDLVYEDGAPVGVRVTHDPKYGNNHYSTCQVACRDLVSLSRKIFLSRCVCASPSYSPVGCCTDNVAEGAPGVCGGAPQVHHRGVPGGVPPAHLLDQRQGDIKVAHWSFPDHPGKCTYVVAMSS
jgi:hypothetical protein